MSVRKMSVVTAIAVFWLVNLVGRSSRLLNDNKFTPNPTSPKREKTKIAAFIRIPKTGSTSLLRFLNEYSGMKPYRSRRSGFPSEKHRKQGFFASMNCFYGPVHTSSASNGTDQQCGHVDYAVHMRYWKHATKSDHAQRENGGLKLQPVTIVREPFDRLHSLFYYMRKFINAQTKFGKTFSTKAQYEQVIAGNFLEWMRLLHVENARIMQWHFLNKHLDVALDMLRGDNPKVLVLLNECFAASLEAFTHTFSLNSTAVQSFVESDDFHANRNVNKVYRNKNDDNERLRVLARKWFVDEYKFYDAAVAQFQRGLSNQDPDVIWSRCKLDNSLLEP